MATKLIPIPRPCSKYYQSFDLSFDKFEEFASEEEFYAYQQFVYEALKACNITFLGWAVAKPAYFSTLAEDHGIGLLVIGLKSDNTKVLLDVTPDNVIEYSRDTLDKLF